MGPSFAPTARFLVINFIVGYWAGQEDPCKQEAASKLQKVKKMKLIYFTIRIPSSTETFYFAKWLSQLEIKNTSTAFVQRVKSLSQQVSWISHLIIRVSCP